MSASTGPNSVPDPDENLNAVAFPTSSESVIELAKGSHRFVIQGFSLVKGIGPGRPISSQEFTVGGYRWAIYFYPDGKNPEDSSGFVSAFVALTSEATDVRALFELTLVDQSGNGRHKVHSHFSGSIDGGPFTLRCRGSMWGFKRFFKRGLLEASEFIKDDCLQINCKVGVVVSKMYGPHLCSIKVPESNLGTQFGKLLDDEEGSDMILDVAGEKFHAHKVVLAARSPLFSSKFFGGSEEDIKEVVINDVEPKVFKAMLHYIYKDSLIEDVDVLPAKSCTASEIPEQLMVKLLEAADVYGLDGLRLMCESRLCTAISVKSVSKLLELAEKYHAKELKAVCLKFAAENLTAVMQSEGFKNFKEKRPTLQSELLRAVGNFDAEREGRGQQTQSECAQLVDGDGARRGRCI